MRGFGTVFFVAILFALSAVVNEAGAAVPTHGSLGHGHGVNLPSGDTNCIGTLQMNYDGSAENGFCWQYAGIAPPYYGAFAECYDGSGTVGGVELKLTGIGYPCMRCDIYLWGDASGVPGTVIGVMPGFNPCPVATWPNVSTHDACWTLGSVDGAFWVGYWLDASNAVCGYFIAADTNGFGGCPMTNIAPGIGYPTGWNDVSIVWGPTQSIGIGAWLGDYGACGQNPWSCCLPDGSCEELVPGNDCPGYWGPTQSCDPNPCKPVPVQRSTWGQIKSTFH